MTTIRVERRDRWVSVSNTTVNDSRLTFRARGILVWLLSKPDDWETSSEAIAAETPEGRDAIRTAMTELETAGYLAREKVRGEGGRMRTMLTFRESPATDFQASADQSSVSQAPNKEPRQTTETNPSLRSGATSTQEAVTTGRDVARDYWDWHLVETGNQSPAQNFKALMSVANACLKRGGQPDEILDAWKNMRRSAFTAANTIDKIGAMRREAENRPSTAAIPSALVQDMVKAHLWFDTRWPGWYAEHRIAILGAMGDMIRWGYGIGESMIRLAIAMRDPSSATSATSVARINSVDRFPGRLADPIDAMESAYCNKFWRAA